jgi:hypothetical protein
MNLKQTIMQKYDWNEKEADSAIEEAKTMMYNYLDDGDQESAYNICEEMFGLEPDFLFDILEI